jgi:hypothetical protein
MFWIREYGLADLLVSRDLQMYVESYRKQKPNRHLEWRWNTGQVTLEIEFHGKTMEYTVPLTLAIVLLPFHDHGR